jgi:hypothetical protein
MALSKALIETAEELSARSFLPSEAGLTRVVADALRVLEGESRVLRPEASDGLPGGLLDLPDLPVVIVPDLHARPDFLAAVLSWRPPLSRADGSSPTLSQLLEAHEAVLLCLGDAFHSEGAVAASRWSLAMREYLGGWKSFAAMDEEMVGALSCVELILRTKQVFPTAFHYLKGNHDNIANEEGRGDHPFYKYALEGEMTSSWFSLRFGEELKSAYRNCELLFPVLARGARFVASHAEPATVVSAGDIIEYRRKPELVEALTWTPNDGAMPGSVSRSLAKLLGPAATGARWFGGHRPVDGRYVLRQDGLYVQFHNPSQWNVALIRPGEAPDPAVIIYNLKE